MTTRDLVQNADQHPLALAAALATPPVVAWVAGRLHGRGQGGPGLWKYLYTVLVYIACVPGLVAGVLTAYTVFFSRENLLDTSLLAYFLPIVSMVVTLVLVRKNDAFDDVPGFDRLSGLMVMVGCSFAIALAIQKTKIWIFFVGSIERLFILAGGIFALLKWSAYMLFRQRDEPKAERPRFPEA